MIEPPQKRGTFEKYRVYQDIEKVKAEMLARKLERDAEQKAAWQKNRQNIVLEPFVNRLTIAADEVTRDDILYTHPSVNSIEKIYGKQYPHTYAERLIHCRAEHLETSPYKFDDPNKGWRGLTHVERILLKVEWENLMDDLRVARSLTKDSFDQGNRYTLRESMMKQLKMPDLGLSIFRENSYRDVEKVFIDTFFPDPFDFL